MISLLPSAKLLAENKPQVWKVEAFLLHGFAVSARLRYCLYLADYEFVTKPSTPSPAVRDSDDLNAWRCYVSRPGFSIFFLYLIHFHL